MLATNDFKRGQRVELDGDPYVILDYSTQGASGRSSNTLIKAKLRNLRTGQLIDRAFKSGERVKQPDFELRGVQYLFNEGRNEGGSEGGGTCVFMDKETYEQFPLQAADLALELKYLRPNDEARAMMFNGQCIGVEIPPTVELTVTDTAPGFKGDTVTAALKPAKLETGADIQVPLFIEIGDSIVVDTREDRYVRRA